MRVCARLESGKFACFTSGVKSYVRVRIRRVRGRWGLNYATLGRRLAVGAFPVAGLGVGMGGGCGAFLATLSEPWRLRSRSLLGVAITRLQNKLAVAT